MYDSQYGLAIKYSSCSCFLSFLYNSKPQLNRQDFRSVFFLASYWITTNISTSQTAYFISPRTQPQTQAKMYSQSHTSSSSSLSSTAPLAPKISPVFDSSDARSPLYSPYYQVVSSLFYHSLRKEGRKLTSVFCDMF